MRYSNIPPTDAINTNIPPTNAVLKRNYTGRQLCTVGDVLNWLLTGIIMPDPFNRAGIKDGETFIAVADDETVRKVRDNLLTWSLQDCHATDNGNGTFTMTDFHGRGLGLMQRHWYDKMTPADMKAEACVFTKPHEYHSQDYRAINDHDGHSARQRIWHPKYAYGSLIHNRLLPQLSADSANWLLRHQQRGTMLANIIFSLQKNKRKTSEWNLPDVYGMRTEAAKLRDTPEQTVKIKEKDTVDLAAAIDNWYDLTRLLGLIAPSVSGVKDVTGNPFFGFYLIDSLSNDRDLNKSNNVLAKQLLRNIGELAVMCPQLLAPKKSTVRTNCQEIVRILKKKHRRGKNDN
jgi:hypothetical protein